MGTKGKAYTEEESFRLSPEMKQALRERAEELGKSKDQFIREAIATELNKIYHPTRVDKDLC
ncbi:MAG: ribbon-helix-helix protein, CopG family [Xenococcus sp. (in: cyanobacteria)]